MGSIILYHTSYDLGEPLFKMFVPKIPHNPETGEDNTQARICLSDSIEGCINAMEFQSSIASNKQIIPIVVWEKEFSFDDPFLRDWKFLYEQDLVPDAALTHEYWYLTSIHMKGSHYKITNYSEASSHQKELFIIKPKYKDDIFNFLTKLNVDIRLIEHMDLCSLINDWLPSYFQEQFPFVWEQIKQLMTIPLFTDSDYIEQYELFWGEKPKPQYVLDMESRKLYRGLDIQKSSYDD